MLTIALKAIASENLPWKAWNWISHQGLLWESRFALLAGFTPLHHFCLVSGDPWPIHDVSRSADSEQDA